MLVNREGYEVRPRPAPAGRGGRGGRGAAPGAAPGATAAPPVPPQPLAEAVKVGFGEAAETRIKHGRRDGGAYPQLPRLHALARASDSGYRDWPQLDPADAARDRVDQGRRKAFTWDAKAQESEPV